jgi:hypothetical protein
VEHDRIVLDPPISRDSVGTNGAMIAAAMTFPAVKCEIVGSDFEAHIMLYTSICSSEAFL